MEQPAIMFLEDLNVLFAELPGCNCAECRKAPVKKLKEEQSLFLFCRYHRHAGVEICYDPIIGCLICTCIVCKATLANIAIAKSPRSEE